MYGLKIAATDQVSFGPVSVLMVVKIIWSTVVKKSLKLDWERDRNSDPKTRKKNPENIPLEKKE